VRALDGIAINRMQQLSLHLLQTSDLAALLEEVLDATIELLEADFGNVQLYNPLTDSLEIVTQRGFKKEFLAHFSGVADARAACGRALATRKRVIIEDVLKDRQFKPHRKIAARAGFRAVQSTPLFSRNGDPLGMISTHFRQPHRPSKPALRLVDHYARRAAEIIERKRTEDRLREYEKAIENLEEMIVVVDRDYRYRLANRAFLTYRGLTRSQLLGRFVGDLLNPGVFDNITKGKLDQALAGKIVKYEMPYKYPQHGERDLSISYFPVEEPDGINRVVCVLRDITQRKQAEEDLRRSEARFRSYFELGLIGMAVTSPTKGILEVNDEICRILGYSRDELLKKTWAELTHPDDLAADVKQFKRVMRGEINGYSLEKRWITKDRQVIHSIMAANCHRLPDGTVDYLIGLLQNITARKKAEEEHRKLASLVENSNDFIGLATLEGDVLYVNEAGRRLIGMDGEASTTVFDFMMEKDRKFVAEEILPMIAAKGEWKGELPMRHFQTGAAIPMHVNGFLVKEEGTGRPLALATISRDITALKNAEEELRRSEAHLAEAQRIGGVGSWVFNATTGECVWSKEHFEMVGADPATFEPTRENTKPLIHPEDLPYMEQVLTNAIREQSAYEMEYRIMRSDGVRYHRCIGRPMAKTNGELQFTGVVLDLTDRKRSEQALQDAQTELAHVSRVTAMGEMAASIAHEINQPLGAIVNNSNYCLQLRDRADNKRRDALRDIVSEANRASNIIKRVRAFTTKSPAERNWVDAKETITDALMLIERELSDHGIAVQTKLAGKLIPIWADRVQVQQVLLNLVRNSIDAMENVSRPKRRLIVAAKNHRRDKRAVLISVEDTGRGLQPAQLPRLFEAFYTTKAKGLGMGLRIARSIVEAHGGRVWAKRNANGRGSIFCSTWPG
jgi:PAS domain S-box-containing protein